MARAAAERYKVEGNEKLKADDTEGALACYASGIALASQEISDFVGGLDQAHQLEPAKKLLAQLLSNRAHVLLSLERYAEAVEDCQQAVLVDRENSKAYWRGTTAALKLGQRDVAAELLRQGLQDAWETPGGPALGELLGGNIEEWAAAAREGVAAAQYNLAMAYLKGNGVEVDLDRGGELMADAAAQGDEAAQQMLQQLGLERACRSRVQPHTFEVWARAAAQGDAAAQFNLGLAYLKGEGVERDQQKCIELWRMAASQGDTMAQQNLAALLNAAEGGGVEASG